MRSGVKSFSNRMARSAACAPCGGEDLVGVVAILFGTIPGAYGLSPWISLIVGAAVLYGVLRYFGRNADEAV